MMRTTFALASLLLGLGLGAASGLAQPTDLDPVAELLLDALRERAARPLGEQVLRAEAARLAATLDAERRTDLLAGRLAPGAVLGPAPRPRAGAGGRLRSARAAALGDAESDLLFVPLPPCRVIDTRLSGNGIITAGSTRDFWIAGTDDFSGQGGSSTGCGVPLSPTSQPIAAAVAINLVAVTPAGPGFLKAWEFGLAEPLASIINYSNIGTNLANGVILPIAGVMAQPADLSIEANTNQVHLVADVTGYFTRFPVETLNHLAGSSATANVSLSSGTCTQLVTCTVAVTRASLIVVDGEALIAFDHDVGTPDVAVVNVEAADPVTCPQSDNAFATWHQIPSTAATDNWGASVPIHRVFSQAAGTTVTYRLSVDMVAGANAGDFVETSRLYCLAMPD
jgi:hypothetical protein